MKTPYDVIIKPVISEKSMDDAQAKKYTFKVRAIASGYKSSAWVKKSIKIKK